MIKASPNAEQPPIVLTLPGEDERSACFGR